jgi:CRISPR-associated protein Cas2
MRTGYLVSYDIADPKRLRAVFRTLNSYGDPLQYSVFRCELSAQEKALLVEALDAIIHHLEDQVMIVDLGPALGRARRVIEVLGRRDPPPSNDPLIV